MLSPGEFMAFFDVARRIHLSIQFLVASIAYVDAVLDPRCECGTIGVQSVQLATYSIASRHRLRPAKAKMRGVKFEFLLHAGYQLGHPLSLVA